VGRTARWRAASPCSAVIARHVRVGGPPVCVKGQKPRQGWPVYRGAATPPLFFLFFSGAVGAEFDRRAAPARLKNKKKPLWQNLWVKIALRPGQFMLRRDVSLTQVEPGKSQREARPQPRSTLRSSPATEDGPSPPGRGRSSGRGLKARWPRLHPSRCCPSAQKARQPPGAPVSTNAASASPSPGGEGPPSPRRLRRADRGEGERVIHSCGSCAGAINRSPRRGLG